MIRTRVHLTCSPRCPGSSELPSKKSKFPGDNGSRDVQSVSSSHLRFPSQRSRSVAFGRRCSTAAFSPADVLPSCSPDWGRRVFNSTSDQPPAVVTLMAHSSRFFDQWLLTLALLRSALGQFLGRWYVTYQRSSSGAIDRADGVPCSPPRDAFLGSR